MSNFSYSDGKMCAEGIDITSLAQRIGTPFYVYSEGTLKDNYADFAQAFSGRDVQICYAVKANSNQTVISIFRKLGAGADVVSEGEVRRAIKAGIDPQKIVFSGVGKTMSELKFAVLVGCGQFNVESVAELEDLSRIATSLGKKVDIALRVNPAVDANTHHKISTGRAGDKFGIDFDKIPKIFRRANELTGISVTGLAVHIGSQLVGLQPFERAFNKIKGLVTLLRNEGFVVERIDLGGGLGIPYKDEEPPLVKDYAALIYKIFDPMQVRLTIEPGRRLTGLSGILVTKVIYLKESGDRKFAVVDAAMNDLVRPALYDAWHNILPVKENLGETVTETIDVVGPVCETGDVIGNQRILPKLRQGDLLAVQAAGAYGAVMSSNYNTRLLIPEVMVSGSKFSIIRRRGSYDDLINQDIAPEWSLIN